VSLKVEKNSLVRRRSVQKAYFFVFAYSKQNIQLFRPLTEVSASEVPVIQKKFVSKEATSKAAILKLFWQSVRV